MKRILLIDDEIEMLNSLTKLFNHKPEYTIKATSSPKEALSIIEDNKFDMIITDLKMGAYTGLDMLKKAYKVSPSILGIVVSGYGTIEAGVEAIKGGAFDFIEKPFTSKKLFDTIEKAFNQQGSNDISIKEVVDEAIKGIIYKSESMNNVIELVKKIANSDMNVLVLGESGTGKELIARAIHNLSKGKANPFVPVNCGALPENLFESELFGHEKGAFTGALQSKPGLLEFANNGTFFFDEIGDMSPAIQVKILRMLEERKIRRIGGHKEIDIDVRVIAATNKNIEEDAETGGFRKDLLYRLNTFTITLPPLRERKEDIAHLAKHFMNEICCKNSNKEKSLTNESIEFLTDYQWPGNIRELQNIINRSYYLSQNNIVDVDDIPLQKVQKKFKLDSDVVELAYKEAKDKVIEQFEVEYLSHHLKINNGNISKTAENCDLDRRTIHRLIAKYNIIFKD